MLLIYIVAAILGGGLMVASAFVTHGHEVGGSDHSIEVHHDAEVSHGADHGGHDQDWFMWLPFLSIRFWTYAIGTFGLTGLLLSLLVHTPEPTAAIVAGVTGFLCGTLASTLMRVLRVSEADSGARTADLLGTRGMLLVGCGTGRDGKVRLNVKGEILEMLALPQGASELPSGTDVVIVSVENDRAIVIPTSEILAEHLETT